MKRLSVPPSMQIRRENLNTCSGRRPLVGVHQSKKSQQVFSRPSFVGSMRTTANTADTRSEKQENATVKAAHAYKA